MSNGSTTVLLSCSELITTNAQTGNASFRCMQKYITAASSTSVKTSAQAEGVMSMQTYLKATEALKQATYVFQAAAVVFNVINVCILSTKRMRSPTMAYVIALSVAHLVYTCVSLIDTFRQIVIPYSLKDVFYLTYGIYVSNYLLACTTRVMYGFRCFVSTERLLAVLVPLKARQFRLVRTPLLFIVLMPVVTFLTHIQVCLKLEVYEVKAPDNSTYPSYRYTSIYLQNPEPLDNLGIALKSIFVYGQLLVLMGTSVLTIAVLRKYSGERRQMKTNVDAHASQMRELQLTVTILVSAIVFVLLNLPTVSNSIAYNAYPVSYGPFSVEKYLFYFVQDLGGACFLLALSADFFTYIALSSAYRATLLRFLTPWRRNSSKSTAVKSEITSSTAASTLSYTDGPGSASPG